jgi:hypothetical protein
MSSSDSTLNVKASCSICFSETSNSKNVICCGKCHKIICKKCLTQSLKLARGETPQCPSCKESFTRESLDNMFTKHFRKNILHKFQMKQLMEKEKSFFPETLLLIEKENAHCEFIKLFAYHAELTRKISPTDTDLLEIGLFENINAIRIKMKELKEKMKMLSLSSPSKSFVNKKCQSCENGYLNSEWICQLCNYKTCKNCFKSLQNLDTTIDHVCSEDDIASKKIIDEITKSCPHCFIQVEKSQGCDQMWCTACNGAFNWKTGDKINGPIHNPHYSEYLQKKEKDLLVGCSDDNTWPWSYRHHLSRFINPFILEKIPDSLEKQLMDINLCMLSLGRTRYQEYSQTLYEPLRKLRLRGKISEKEWEKSLSSQEVGRERKLRIKNLNELVILIARDLFLELCRGTQISLHEFQSSTLQSVENLRLYYNSELKNILDEYGCKLKKIDERWSLQ